ncbi:MAG: biotin/lipoyl-containing protein, partial [Alphaproteobacteria bacterium]
MSIEIKVPALGESVTEATVAKWMKQVGEAVAQDEALCELETDKVTLEVNAPAAGTLAEIKAPEGANVEIGQVLGTIAEGAVAAAPKAAPAPKPKAAPATPPPAVQPAAPKPTPAAAAPLSAASLSPAVRKIVAENQV